MANKERGYCSWCFRKMLPKLEQQNYLRRNVYTCRCCNKGLVFCRVATCHNLGRNGEKWDSEFCAMHDGSIADFGTLGLHLREISHWHRMTKRGGLNMVKGVKIAGGVAAVGLVATGVGAPAAGTIGGFIGSLSGLSGAAATSHGLAVLGGGALAAGGGGMALGTVVVAITAGALGGVGGGLLVNKYVSNIEGFSIRQTHSGADAKPRIIYINGFLTAGGDLQKSWMPMLRERFDGHKWFEVDWESKRLRSLGVIIGQGAGGAAFRKAVTEAARHATQQAARKLNPLAWLATLVGSAGNPWHVAMSKSEMTGILLADLISRTSDNKRYILVGHSLGARVAYFTMRALGEKAGARRIVAAHLLGGAIGNKTSHWSEASKAVDGKIHNYYSKNDQVLKVLYSAGTFFSSSAIGRNPIRGTNPCVVNHDVSRFVDGHGAFKPQSHRFVVGT